MDETPKPTEPEPTPILTPPSESTRQLQPIDESKLRLELAASDPKPVVQAQTDETWTPQVEQPKPQVVIPPLESSVRLDGASAEIMGIIEPDTGQSTRRWKVESVFITLVSLLIVGIGVIGVLPAILTYGFSKDVFMLLVLYGIPSFIGLLLLKRSDMARRIVMVFLLINIVFEMIPLLRGTSVNIPSTVLSAAVLIFLALPGIKRHF